jgi:hypothetical protein
MMRNESQKNQKHARAAAQRRRGARKYFVSRNSGFSLPAGKRQSAKDKDDGKVNLP